MLAITICFPSTTRLKSIFGHLHLTKPTPSHYLHTHLHTHAHHHSHLHLPIPRSPTPLTTLLIVYIYFSLHPSSSIMPIFMHTIPHYPPQAFSCNVQLAHACSLPRSLPYSAASACHGEDRLCNPHTIFPSAFLSRACTHTSSATMAAKRLKELLETRKPSVHETHVLQTEMKQTGRAMKGLYSAG